MNAPASSPIPIFDSETRESWWRRFGAGLGRCELIAQLTWRNLRAGRKQSLLGLGWVLIHPLVQLGVFTILFTEIVPLRVTKDVPYALLTFPALITWGFFTRAILASAGSIVDSASLVTKTYFPREVLVYASVSTYVVNLALNSMVAGILMASYSRWPTVHALYVPLILLAVFLLTTGLSLIVAALNVFWRDVEALLPLVLQAWFFATPVVYPISQVPETLRPYFKLNPLAAPMEGLRTVLLDGRAPDLCSLAVSLASGFAVFVVGIVAFKRCERLFSDLI